jgi:galactitol-specific phosphotransferase system IIC component
MFSLEVCFLVGIGFAGVNMVINWFVSQVAVLFLAWLLTGYSDFHHDVGWPARAAATWAFPGSHRRIRCTWRQRLDAPYKNHQHCYG